MAWCMQAACSLEQKEKKPHLKSEGYEGSSDTSCPLSSVQSSKLPKIKDCEKQRITLSLFLLVFEESDAAV